MYSLLVAVRFSWLARMYCKFEVAVRFIPSIFFLAIDRLTNETEPSLDENPILSLTTFFVISVPDFDWFSWHYCRNTCIKKIEKIGLQVNWLITVNSLYKAYRQLHLSIMCTSTCSIQALKANCRYQSRK